MRSNSIGPKSSGQHITLRSGCVGVLALLCQIGPLALTAQAAAPRFNDTGQTTCYDPGTGLPLASCIGTGQDAASGRDQSVPSSKDGQAGFSFNKIAADGSVLPRDAKQWACVEDRVTGLTWEVKTRDRGLRDRNRTYTQRGDGSSSEVSAFVAAVNAQGLCGHQDWRLPSNVELVSLVNYMRPKVSNAAIDVKWFPNTSPASFWTGTPSPAYGSSASAYWGVGFYAGDNGPTRSDLGATLRARLVRGAPLATEPRFLPLNDEVQDSLTGLIWRRCAEGQTWTGNACSGSAASYNWASALAQAQAAAAQGVAWRLPSAKELSSLTDESRVNAAIDPQAFPGTVYSKPFWTSTTVRKWPLDAPSLEAWWVSFDLGNLGTSAKDASHHIRLVRTAP